ncbi:unnamed protein product [Spirodela intermedia]|uniref:Fucosyltransferase n=1 Tax=Spirodela intermedia TaxID=51605 RepID=A0A7I8JZ21_SPIIN|nr:unnamed protein product [Spirodela intermedia]CAB1184549.1 unnamed protein product [Spirodela intermedia]
MSGFEARTSAAGSDALRDKYLDGLLAAGLYEDSCRSRYEAVNYRHLSPYKPSAYLVQKLREYEDRHRRCAPHTNAYKKMLPLLTGGVAAGTVEECKYLLWTPFSGLGNKIISLTSSFLYALLTERVLLIDRGRDFSKLFCEPFPGTSWLIPEDFPMKNLYFNRGDPLSYGSLVREKGIVNPLPSFVYAHVVTDFAQEDARFFFEEDQRALRGVPWLLVRSEVHYAAGLFLNADFEPELSRLFPETETVFHHLSRYLLHPSNKAWGMITRYYHTYLAKGKERLGIQIRIFNHENSPFENVSTQVVNCLMKEKLLPEIDLNDPQVVPGRWKIMDVIVTTLHSGYLDKIRSIYWEHPAAGGVLVSVHQPSHEEYQLMDDESHDMKAWAEMNLLSFSDVLVTSAWSTFGYVGQGLGGLKPWILLRPKSPALQEPSCVRDISMEPCFHLPPAYLCEQKMDGKRGKVAPYVTYCVDVEGGLKVLARNNEVP